MPTPAGRLTVALDLHRRASLAPELEAAVVERLELAGGLDLVRRVWERDATLWGEPGAPEIADRLGWLDGPAKMRAAVGELDEFRRECADDGLTDVVLLGMGGSSLAPEVLRRSYVRGGDGLELHVLDSTDPGAVLSLERRVDVERSLFLVSTKSGGTIETLSLFEYFFAGLSRTRGAEAGRSFAAITDPGSSLVDLAQARGFRRTFLNDPDIGGRYSALSYFGLVPAALVGIDLVALLDRAALAVEDCQASGEENDGLWLGAALGELARHGRDKLTLVLAEPIAALGLWVEQLIAESTGKQGRGILPVVAEPLAEPAAYGPDRVFVVHDEGGRSAELEALRAAGHPVIELPFNGVEDLGRLFFLWEFATAVAGWTLAINPFDQPNVQEAKDRTAAVLEQHAETGGLPDVPPAGEHELRALVGGLEPPRYLALMAYLAPSPEIDRAAQALRVAVRDAFGVATTFGYGPRFLHSTGQCHKGGPPTGAFLQLVHSPAEDVPVPGAVYSFATLIAAQATGDLEALRGHGLPAERVELTGDPAEALAQLGSRLAEVAD